jgi:hypothetical protein
MRLTTAAPRRARHGVITVAALTAGSAAALALLAACGGSAHGSGTTSGAAPSGAAANRAAAPGARGPAASGTIAEIDGNTVQVQNTEGQVAVSVSDRTTYTQTTAATLAAVRVGSCITAISASTATGAPSSGTSGSEPQTFIADAIVVTSAVDGSCTRGFGGAAGPRGSFTAAPSRFRAPSEAPSEAPSGAPATRPTGSAGQLPRTLGATGLVTAVDGSTITVKAERRALPATPAASPSPTATPTMTTSTVTVTVTAATKYTETIAATKAALRVGLCLTADGTTGSDGTVSATRVALSPPAASGGCTAGFGRERFGGGAAGTAGAAGGGAPDGGSGTTGG